MYLKDSGSSDKEEDENKSSIAYQLTDGKDFHIHEFDISTDGEKVVFIASSSPVREDQNRGLYILDIKAGELQETITNKLLGGSVCFSPNGTQICYTASIREKDYYKTHVKDSTLEIYNMNSGEVFQPLTDFDSTVTPIRWTAKGILIRWQNKTNYLIGLLSEDGKVDRLSEKTDCCIIDVSITEDGNHIAYNKATSNETFEVYIDHKKNNK